MNSAEALKQQLTSIKDNGYSIPPGVDLDALIADMLVHIGDTDAELRDALIYSTFREWVDSQILSAAQRKHILTICLDERHLFFGIGENGTDSVFTRAFSSLPISLVLWSNQNEAPLLTAAEILDIKETVLRYIDQEKDCRGYVDGKGWAHAIAHIADALGFLAEASVTTDSEENFSLGREGLLEILEAVKMMISRRDGVYTAEEDERLAVPVMDVIYREVLTNEDIIRWIDSFNMGDKEWLRGTMPDSYYLYVNRKHFMRSLYFKLLSDSGYPGICEHMLTFLAKADKDNED